jgi:D-amino-acid dehydrogenase
LGELYIFEVLVLHSGFVEKRSLGEGDRHVMIHGRSFEQVPAWLARAMKEDIYYVNREAGKLWAEFMDRTPDLFKGVSLHPNILRLYAEDVALTAAHRLNRSLETVIDESSLPELLKENTGFYAATKSDDLAGGFTVQGFTLGIHSFVNKLIDRIIDLGGEFTWDCSVQHIRRNASGEVALLESELGPLQADNYVISTGVTRNGLLDGTASSKLINGVLGVWLQIPNLEPMLRKSTKIHRRGSLVEDINVTVSRDAKTGEDILILGGGYGYVGLGFPALESSEMQALFAELEVVAGIYFPAAYRCAKERGSLWPEGERKFCIRPFTCTGLGIFEDIPTASGGHLIITGGNNTGGFAQAPAIARAICRAVVGEHDPIHVLFNPHRSKLLAQTHY